MTERAVDRWLAAALFLYGVAVALPLLFAAPRPAPDDPIDAAVGSPARAELVRSVASLTYDDGFYYLSIARHLAGGAGSTFDGSHPTNGYHPLWLLCLALVATLWRSTDGLLLSSFAAQALAAALNAVLVYRIARRFAGPLPALVAGVGWIRLMHTHFMPWSGMEYGFQSLAVAALVWYDLRRRQQAPAATAPALVLALLAVLAFLARLDNLLLGLFVGGALLLHRPRRPGLLVVATLVLAAAVYAALNGWWFGAPLPVSGALKSAWSTELLAADPRFLEHGWLVAKLALLWWPLGGPSGSFAAGLYLGSLGAVALLAVRPRGPLRALWPVAAFALAQLLSYVVAFHGGYSFQPWYYAVQPLLAAVLVGSMVEVAGRRLRHLGVATPGRLAAAGALSLAAVVVLSSAGNVARRVERQRRYAEEPLYAAAAWVRGSAPPAALVGAWNAGTIAYLAERPVVNLDGLVNSWTFFRTERHDLCGYLEREGISLLVDVFALARPFSLGAAPLGSCSDRFERIWVGPEIPGSPPRRGALAFRRRQRAPGRG